VYNITEILRTFICLELFNKLTPWRKVQLEKLIVAQLVKDFPPLWNPKFHYIVHKSPPLVYILSQMHPAHTFQSFFPKINSDIIFPSTSRSSAWSLPFRFSDQNLLCIFHLTHAYIELLQTPINSFMQTN
jgi:hypothetical protein